MKIPGKHILLMMLYFHGLVQFTSAQETATPDYQLKGYIKDLQTTSFVNDADSVTTSNLIHNRINFKYNFAKHFYTRIELRNRLFYGEQVKLNPGFADLVSADFGYINLTKVWVDNESVVLVSSFDRLLLNYSSGRFSITAGRQRINWGINNIWNPNDIFNAYNFLDFDYEERPGIDALRVQYQLKFPSTIELAYKPAEDKNESIAALLFKTNKWKYDWQILTGIYYNDLVLGGGWAGNIKEAGFKGEFSCFRNYHHVDSSQDKSILSISSMLDYSFKNNWYASVALLYQSEPMPVIPGVGLNYYNNLTAKTLMPYRLSTYMNLMKSISPILSASFAVIYSPSNNSTIFFPTLTWSVANNFDLDLMMQSFFAQNDSEYKTQVSSVFLRIKWNF